MLDCQDFLHPEQIVGTKSISFLVGSFTCFFFCFFLVNWCKKRYYKFIGYVKSRIEGLALISSVLSHQYYCVILTVNHLLRPLGFLLVSYQLQIFALLHFQINAILICFINLLKKFLQI